MADKISVYTYDILSVVNHELQVSPQTVNSVARLAYKIFPELIERIDISNLPNLWVNRILIQLEDASYGIVDADLWFKTSHYLKNFAGLEIDDFLYKKDGPFQSWFDLKVRTNLETEIEVGNAYNFPEFATREYVDITSRIQLSLYTLDSFGPGPRNTLIDNNNQQN